MKRDLYKEFQGGVAEVTGRWLKVIEKVNILGMQLKVYGDIEEPLFLAKEIACSIDHSNVSKMVECLGDRSNITSGYIDNTGGKANLLLKENQVYRILMRSDKPKAIEIQEGLYKFLKSWRKGEVKVIENKPISKIDIMKMAIAEIETANNRIDVLEYKVDNRMGLSGAQAAQIGKLVSKRVFERANNISKYEINYIGNQKLNVSMLYSDINKNLKAYYGVSIRSDIPQSKYEEACSMIENWKESYETKSKFIKINQQKEI